MQDKNNTHKYLFVNNIFYLHKQSYELELQHTQFNCQQLCLLLMVMRVWGAITIKQD